MTTQSLIDCNFYRLASVWRRDARQWDVAFGHDDPSVGIVQESFRTCKEALEYAQQHSTLDIWLERRDHYVRVQRR